ncbi:hypothetical protein, partial [Lacticaseibacillus paracasei]|uniref:hypothetical protein n=1 Tax=Lacticaseibacillus paracasei TaxID=1597 RepID=UPI0021AA3D43
AHAITTDAWRNSLDHYQEFVIIVALDLKIEGLFVNAFRFLLITIKKVMKPEAIFKTRFGFLIELGMGN